jgi:hypothetical protein
MHEAMADHFVFALEALAAFGARAALDRAVVWSILAVHICVGTRQTRLVSRLTKMRQLGGYSLQQILRLKRQRIAPGIIAPKRPQTMLAHRLHSRTIRRRQDDRARSSQSTV